MNHNSCERIEIPDLVIRGMAKRFGVIEALSKIEFSVFKGEILGRIGPNGAGKRHCWNASAACCPRMAARFSGGVALCR
jgi:ABC-type branched-subunit amino acid transport system ATPase component